MELSQNPDDNNSVKEDDSSPEAEEVEIKGKEQTWRVMLWH